MIRPLEWKDGRLRLLDQGRLPKKAAWLEVSTYRQAIACIRELRVRGAPAIGVAGAYSLVLAAQETTTSDMAVFLARLRAIKEEIAQARPTAVNLGWALDRLMQVAQTGGSPGEVQSLLLAEAQRIHREQASADQRMGELGSALLRDGDGVLTHCNTGALATGGYGTALNVIFTAWAQGKKLRVFATETRPLLQGARLTTWELLQQGIPATLLTDSTAGHLMSRGLVDSILVGADRIVANGDTANKIGTYTLAVLARAHRLPFYVVAPTSTVDTSTPSGKHIPIEERQPEEVTTFGRVPTAPEGVQTMNPAFDVTPSRYITAIITEQGIVRRPFREGLLAAKMPEDGHKGKPRRRESHHP